MFAPAAAGGACCCCCRGWPGCRSANPHLPAVCVGWATPAGCCWALAVANTASSCCQSGWEATRSLEACRTAPCTPGSDRACVTEVTSCRRRSIAAAGAGERLLHPAHPVEVSVGLKGVVGAGHRCGGLHWAKPLAWTISISSSLKFSKYSVKNVIIVVLILGVDRLWSAHSVAGSGWD